MQDKHLGCYNFVGLPELYGLKYDKLITLVIVFVLVLLYFGRFCDNEAVGHHLHVVGEA